MWGNGNWRDANALFWCGAKARIRETPEVFIGAFTLPALVCAVLLCGAVYAGVCIGLGTLLQRALGLEPSPMESFWLGLSGLTAFLEIYQLVRPVDAFVAVALLIVGAAGFSGGSLSRIADAARRNGPWAWGIYTALLLLIAARCATPCKFFDTGSYGAQTIRWLSTYRIVPGLVNLHGRFGFNSSAFLLMAPLHHGLLIPLSCRVFDALLVAMLLAPVTAACVRIARGASASRQDWFWAIVSFPMIYRVFESSIIADLVGTDTDLPALVAALAATGSLFAALNEWRTTSSNGKKKSVREKLIYAAALLAVAAVFKLSLAVLAVTGWLLGLVVLLSLRPSGALVGSRLLTYMLIPAAIVVPWIGRGLVLSGYPFYPSGLFGIPVSWRLPVQSVRLVAAGVRDWARWPHATLAQAAGWYWIRPWFRDNHYNRAEFVFPMLIATVGFALILWQEHGRDPWKGRERRENRALWLAIPLVCALIFWFLSAPALRFGQAALWGMAAVLGGCGIAAVASRNASIGRWALIAILAAEAWSMHPRTLWRDSFAPLADVKQFSPLPPPNSVPVRLPSGLVVNIAPDGLAWDAELPSAPYRSPTLRLRRPGDLRSGFVSDGLPPRAEWNTEVKPESSPE
jgi:hypothetical protein